MKTEPDFQKPLSKNMENIIKDLSKNMKDPDNAKIMQGVLRAGLNGHEEMADIMRRMIGAELKYHK